MLIDLTNYSIVSLLANGGVRWRQKALNQENLNFYNMGVVLNLILRSRNQSKSVRILHFSRYDESGHLIIVSDLIGASKVCRRQPQQLAETPVK